MEWGSEIPKSGWASTWEKSMAETAARPEAGENAVFLEVRLKEEEGNDFPRAIPKEAKAKAKENDILKSEERK